MQIGMNLSLTLEHVGAGAPTLDMTFTGTGNALDSRITFTRASTATYFDSNGVLQTAGNDVPRLDYNPSTLAAQGLLIEEQRTNSIRNNTMQGAVAGTPGTLPTNWITGGGGLGTLTREIIGTGTSNGITYIDIRFSGTTSTTGFSIGAESSTSGPAASVGQTWTMSNFFAMVGGSITNINAIRAVQIFGRDAGGASSGDTFSGADIKSSVTSTLTRFTVSGTVAQATTATLQPIAVAFNFASGVAIDITLRIGLPQLEQGAFATSVIPTTTTALTRNADQASVNTLSPWYNATEGTLFMEVTPVGVRSTASPIVTIDDGTTSNRIAMTVTAANAMQNSTVVSGSLSGNTTTPSTTYAANSTYKIAFAVKLDDVQSFSGGAAGTIDTTALIPSGLTALKFAAQGASTGLNNVWMRRFTYYPRRLSAAEGQAITA